MSGGHTPDCELIHYWVRVLLHHTHCQPFLFTTQLLAGPSLPIPWTDLNPSLAPSEPTHLTPAQTSQTSQLGFIALIFWFCLWHSSRQDLFLTALTFFLLFKGKLLEKKAPLLLCSSNYFNVSLSTLLKELLRQVHLKPSNYQIPLDLINNQLRWFLCDISLKTNASPLKPTMDSMILSLWSQLLLDYES